MPPITLDLPPDGAVLFDLDGVLVDSRAAFTQCINDALVANGHSARPPAALHRFIGPPMHETLVELIGGEPDSAAVDACANSYRRRYAAVAAELTSAFPGIADALEELRHTRTLGVATSKPIELAEPLLRALGLRDHFDVVVGPSLSERSHEKSSLVASALRTLNAAGGAMVGDRSFDMVAARANGLVAIGVTWGIGSETELLESGADHLVSEPSHLTGLLGGRRTA